MTAEVTPAGAAVPAGEAGPRVTHVCVTERLHKDPGRVGVTAIDKRAVDGPVQVRDLGLFGDVQADRANHGGRDKAVYLFSAAEIGHWEAELGRGIPPGGIGENLRVEGLAVDDAVFGERWRIGATLTLEITGPRNPCATFARWMDRPSLIKEFNDRARKGVYARVVEPGPVCAGDAIEVLSVPTHAVSVRRWNVESDPADARALLAAEAAGEVELAPYLSKYLLAAAGRDGDVERLRVLLADDAAGNISLSETAREQLRAAVERADMPAAATAEEPDPGSSGLSGSSGTSRPSGASASSAEGGR